MEQLAKAFFHRHQERFVRPLLLATSQTEARRALRAHRLEYVGSRLAGTAFMLALKPWDHLTPAVADEFYAHIQEHLQASPFGAETIQKIDYVAYSSAQIALLSMRLVRTGAHLSFRPKKRDDLIRPLRAMRAASSFDVLTSAAFTAAKEPSLVKDEAVLSWLMDRAVRACDAHLAIFAELGYF
jgi:hypothetical protein